MVRVDLCVTVDYIIRVRVRIIESRFLNSLFILLTKLQYYAKDEANKLKSEAIYSVIPFRFRTAVLNKNVTVYPPQSPKETHTIFYYYRMYSVLTLSYVELF